MYTGGAGSVEAGTDVDVHVDVGADESMSEELGVGADVGKV